MEYAKIWYTAYIQRIRQKTLDIATEIWKAKRKELWSEIKMALQSALSSKDWKERQQLIRATFWDWFYLRAYMWQKLNINDTDCYPWMSDIFIYENIVCFFDGFRWYSYDRQIQKLDSWAWPFPGLPISIDNPVDYIINEKYKNPYWSEYKTVSVKTSKNFGSYESE